MSSPESNVQLRETKSGSDKDTDISCEPGVSRESMIIPTDTFEEFTREMRTAIHEIPETPSKINQIRDELKTGETSTEATVDKTKVDQSEHGSDKTSSTDLTKSSQSDTQLDSVQDESQWDDDYLTNADWMGKPLHVFVLSSAGKPIYSLDGNEDKLAALCGVMQALVSVIETNDNDQIVGINAVGVKFVFLVKNALILVAVSRLNHSIQQIQFQLTDVYNQIISVLTLNHLNKFYEKRKNFDLRRLIAGSERLITHLLVNDNVECHSVSNNPFILLTHSVRILPLSPGVRDTITAAIQSNCAKIKDLVFAILIADNKLVTLVRMRKYFIHPADLRLIFNLIQCSESFKSMDGWTPICLPKFDPNGFLHGLVSYLAPDCEACLVMFSVDRGAFFNLLEAKKKITDKLRRTNCLEAINNARLDKGINLKKIGIPEIRHFLYKSKSNAQLLCSEISEPYGSPEEFSRLNSLYSDVHHRIHNSGRPLKLIYELREKEIVLAWVTAGYELYATFEPTVDKTVVISLVNKLLRWIKKDEDTLFILNAPTF